MRIGIVIQAQLEADGSLRDEILFKKVNEKTILEYTLSRVLNLDIDKVIILSSPANSECRDLKLVKDNDVDVFINDQQGFIKSYKSICEKWSLDKIVRVIGNNPLIEPELVEQGIASHFETKAEYTYFKTLPRGLAFSEIIDYNVLNNENVIKNENMLEKNSIGIVRNGNHYKINKVSAADDYTKHFFVNLTVDEFNFSKIEKYLADNFTWKEILGEVNSLNSTEDIVKYKWNNEKFSEVNFWRQEIKRNLDKNPDYYNRNKELQDYVVECLEEGKKSGAVSILDVGAGVITVLGDVWAGGKVNITAVDALAEEYKTLLDEYKIKPRVTTQKCDVEQLSFLFGENKFDIVHMRNALDHSYNPLRGIQQMLEVVKPGGFVVLYHFVNEGVNENYVGLHQWNFCDDDGKFVIWNYGGDRICIDDEVRESASIQTQVIDDVIIVKLRKNY